MRTFTLDATRLAFARQRVVTGRDHIGGQRDEAELLLAVASDRQRLLATAPQAQAQFAQGQFAHDQVQQPAAQQTHGPQAPEPDAPRPPVI